MDPELEDHYFDVSEAFNMEDYPSFRQIPSLIRDATLGNIIEELSKDPRTASFLADETYLRFLDDFQENPAHILCSDQVMDPRIKTTLCVLLDMDETGIERILNIEPTQIINGTVTDPTVSELEKIAQGNDMLEEECVGVNNGDHNSPPSDTDEVIESDVVHLQGKIIDLDEEKIIMLPNHEKIKVADINQEFEMQIKKLIKVTKEVSEERKYYENAEKNLDIELLEISEKLKDLKTNSNAMNAEICSSLTTITDSTESISHILEKNFDELKAANYEIYQELSLAKQFYSLSQMKMNEMREKLSEVKEQMEEMKREQSEFEKRVKQEIEKLEKATKDVVQEKKKFTCCIM